MIDKEEEAFLAGLRQEFIDSAPLEMDELEETLLKYDKGNDEQHIRDCKRRLHSMKGSAQSVTLFELASFLHHFETWINNHFQKIEKQEFVSFNLSMVDGLREYFKALLEKNPQANTLLQALAARLQS